MKFISCQAARKATDELRIAPYLWTLAVPLLGE
jgi:hypothetical protein